MKVLEQKLWKYVSRSIEDGPQRPIKDDELFTIGESQTLDVKRLLNEIKNFYTDYGGTEWERVINEHLIGI